MGLALYDAALPWIDLFHLDATESSSVALFCWALNSKTKSKPSELPDSNFIFFVATKPTGSILESEAKESLTLRWACLAR